MSYSEEMLKQLEAGQLEAAKKSFAWALRKDDDDTLYSLAEELYALGLTNQAQRTYLKLLQKYPQEDELRTTLAEIAIDNGENDEALSYLAQIKPDSPAYLQSLLVAADLYQTEGQFEVTAAKLQEAYQLAPDEPAVLFALAEYYYLVGDFQRAIPYYFALLKAGQLDFARVDIAGRLGMAYAQLGRFDQALGYLEQVAPGYQTSDVRFQTGLTQLALHQEKAATATLRDLIKDDPQYAAAYPALARAYSAEKQDEKALQTVQEGLAVDQYNEHLYALGAQIASRLQESALMDRYLKRAHELDPDNVTIALEYSNLLLAEERDEENLALLAPLARDNADPQVFWNLARSAQRQEDFARAREAYQMAATGLGANPDFLRDKIEFDQEMGDQATELQDLRAYLALEPADSEMAARLEELAADQF